jgi:hypothetical protein
MTMHAIGIILFAGVTGLNAAGLMLDAALFAARLPTISEWARRNPWFVAIVIITNAAGLFGLALHFSNGRE